MGGRNARAALVVSAACAALLTTSEARAQSQAALGDVALNQLEPSPAGDAFYGVPSPFIGGHLAPRGLVMVDHAEQPLVISTASASGVVVSRQTLLHINASLALWDRLLVGVLLPVVVAQGGESPVTQGVSIPSPDSAAVGDLRLSARIRFFGEDSDPFQLAAGVHIHVPTGRSGSFAGDGSVRDSPHVLFGGRAGRFVWSASVGAMIRHSDTPSSLVYGAGVGVRLWDDRLQIGPEVFASTPLFARRVRVPGLNDDEVERSSTTNLEALLGARLRLPLGFLVGLGAGAGLTDAIGTPAFRAVGALGWELPTTAAADAKAQPDDADEDGILGAADACPYAFGPKSADPKRSGCPEVDSDEDGVLDPDDACRDVPGDVRPGSKTNGCPEAPPAAGSDGPPS